MKHERLHIFGIELEPPESSAHLALWLKANWDSELLHTL